MNRLVLALTLSVTPAFAQGPPAAPTPSVVGVPGPNNAPSISETSRISHVVSGPNGRAQGLLLRNGSFVNLSPGLSQQIQASVRHNATVSVSGPAYGSGSDKTIQARQLTIAGVSYNDAPMPGRPLAGPRVSPPPAGPQAPPPPPPGGPRAARGPRGRGMAPPPPPCAGVAAAGAPAPAPGGQTPPPPAAPAPPPPAQN